MSKQQQTQDSKQPHKTAPQPAGITAPEADLLLEPEPLDLLLQRAELAPHLVTPGQVSRLQRTIGNQAMGRFGGRGTIQETADNGGVDNVAHTSFQAILHRAHHTPNGATPELQMQSNGPIAPEGGAITPDVEDSIQSGRGGGQHLSDSVRAPMEQAFGADFSGVKVHTNGESDALNQSLSARAFTTGSDIFFRQGEYDPHSSAGQELLAHELTHVVQQGSADELRRQPDNGAEQRPDEEVVDEAPPSNPDGEIATAEISTDHLDTASGSTAVSQPGVNGAGPQSEQGVIEGAGEGVSETAVSANGNAPENGLSPSDSGESAAGDTDAHSPASAAEDPGFQAVAGRAGGVAAGQSAHQDAPAAAGHAQAAAPSPSNELSSQAATAQVDEMNEQEPQPFDKAAFKEALLARIAELTPQTLADADDFPDDNNLDAMQTGLASEVDESRESSEEDIADTTEEAPDTGAIEPRQPEELQPEAAGPPPPSIHAQEAAPPSRTETEIEAPIREGSQELDQQMAEAEITEEQLENANEPEFTAALETKQEAQTVAEETPTTYRQQEQEMVAGAESEAETEAVEGLTGMNAERSDVLSQVMGEQQTTQTADEAERSQVAGRIEEIYENTQQSVEDRLTQLDEEVDASFSEGSTAAQEAFENYHRRRMDAYKDDRYSGLDGAILWASDKLFGMPDEVNLFYQEGRRRYIAQMDGVLDRVAEIVSVGLTEAKNIIAQGRQEVQEYVASLPESLREVGQEAADNIQSRFDELEQRVEDKQGELIDSLAQRYNENLQALDARIEELQAENQGLVDAALDAIGGVIQTILELKSMLEDVLSRAADAIRGIIEDPIGFLGNLISAVQLGLENFVSNIGEHLQAGLVGWLTGALTEAGIELPETWDLAGIFQLVMQVLGLSFDSIMGRVSDVLGFDVMGVWDTIQELIGVYQEGGLAGLAQYGLARIIGEDNMGMLMQVVEMVQILMEGDFGRLWEMIQGHLTDLKDLIFDQIKEFLIERVIRAGVTWIISLFNPASAFVRACMMIYDVIMFFVERGSQIMSLVSAVIDSVTSIAQGNISGAAAFVENALARAVPVAISFLASLLGLGGISDKVRDAVESVQNMVDSALDAVFSSGPVQAVAGFIGRAIARVQQFISAGVERAGDALGFGAEEANGEFVNENGEANDEAIARQAAQTLEQVDGDLDDYTALRREKETQARQIEQTYSSMLESGVGLKIEFGDARRDMADNDLDFTVTIAPNDTVTEGSIGFDEDTLARFADVRNQYSNIRQTPNEEWWIGPYNNLTSFRDALRSIDEERYIDYLYNYPPDRQTPEAHHIVEQRHAEMLSLNPGTMPSVLIPRSLHRQLYTPSLNQRLKPGEGPFTVEEISIAYEEVYQSTPELLGVVRDILSRA